MLGQLSIVFMSYRLFYVLQGVSKELSRVKIANFKEENVSFLDNLYLSSLTNDMIVLHMIILCIRSNPNAHVLPSCSTVPKVYNC